MDNVWNWVARLRRWVPITRIVVETVRFDTQLLQNPEIAGVQYQQGTLAGYEVRAYLLEKWARRCAYCDISGVPLQIEHIRARSRGGSDRVSNLTLACRPCNRRKDIQPIEVFLARDPKRLTRILAQAQERLRDPAAVNTTRWTLWRRLSATKLPVEVGTGGRTRWNRHRFHLPKTHALDALCVGVLGDAHGWTQAPLVIQATGRGQHQRTQVTASGFPRGYLTRSKTHYGFQTGDLVRAVVPTGKHKGVHIGRVTVRASGSFDIQTGVGLCHSVAARYCTLLQRADSYCYTTHPAQKEDAAARRATSPPPSEDGSLHIRLIR